MKSRFLILTTMLLACCGAPAWAANTTDPVLGEPDHTDMRLLRNPDIHGDMIVFTYAGNLWTVGSKGGQARRLTSSEGYQSQPKFSPDGKYIAFSGNYDGNNDVYVIPAGGGEPTRLTFHPGWDRVIDWQPDGRSVRFQSPRRSRTGRDLQLFTVDMQGGLPRRIPLPTAGLSSYGPDGVKIAFNRISRENRTWKRYKGGMAQDIWIYDFHAGKTRRLTDWVGTDNYPMWQGRTVYFTSDRGGNLQIWAHDLDTDEEHQVTHHPEYDVKFPSQGPGAIVYECGGWLWVLDLQTEQSTRLKISLYSDNTIARPRLKSVDKLIDGAGIGPDANRAVFSARGDIFTVPAEKGPVRNLTQTPGIRDRGPVWSPDGKWVAYLGDGQRAKDPRAGYEVYLRPADGQGKEKMLTHKDFAWPRRLMWSPDSKHLLMNDAAMNLWLIDADSGKLKKIDQGLTGIINDFGWSPGSDWVVYARTDENDFNSIFLYKLGSGKTHRVTTDFTNESNPCFDDKGDYLFFVSARNFNPTLGGFDLKPLWTNMDGLYVVPLRKDVPHPFPPESDEVAVKSGDKDKDADKKDEKDDKDDEGDKDEDLKITIDLDGLAERTIALDVSPGNYYGLSFANDKLFYMDRPFTPGGTSGDQRPTTSLKFFDMKERETKTVLKKCRSYELADGGKKVFYNAGGSFGIVDAKADQKPADKPLRTAEMKARVDPRAEWQEMFRDAWGQEKDFFYDPGMHGVDWDHMYERYGQLVPYVAHGVDFSYLIGELIGELNCSHSYVRPGDVPRPDRIGTGLLGCDFTLDRENGMYRFARIFTDRDWNGGTPLPLNQPGSEVKQDEYLLAVNGIALKAPVNPYSLLVDTAGKEVVLKVGPNPDGKNSREITVVPVASEHDMRYEAWVQHNRRRVDELSDGRIGYLHLPNTAVGGQQGFAKGYYPNLRKEGLIIDERFNGGGFIPDFFMNILRQKLVNLWKPRYGRDWRTPGTAFVGHMAMISNGYAGSGGDALPYYFKHYDLGPVIGERTWGGLVGISGGLRLMDGGAVTDPTFGIFDLNGKWDVENHGVDPDIEIDNLPEDEMAGRDPQLEKAVAYLLNKIKTEPVQVPTVKQFPRDKN